MPEVCSLVAALRSLIRSVTCWTCLTMPVMAAHFAGHNGKAAALFAGAGRFHGCIPRQDIRLKGDAGDDADDVQDFPVRHIDLPHGYPDVSADFPPTGRGGGSSTVGGL